MLHFFLLASANFSQEELSLLQQQGREEAARYAAIPHEQRSRDIRRLVKEVEEVEGNDYFTQWGMDMQRLKEACRLPAIYLDSFTKDEKDLSGTQLIIRRIKSASDWTSFSKAGAWVGIYGEITFSDEQIKVLTTVPDDQFSALLAAHAELMHNRRIENEGARAQQPLEGIVLYHARIKATPEEATKTQLIKDLATKILTIDFSTFDFSKIERYIQKWEMQIIEEDWENLFKDIKTHPEYPAVKKTYDDFQVIIQRYRKTYIAFPQFNAPQNPEEIWILLHGTSGAETYFTEESNFADKFRQRTKKKRDLTSEWGFDEKDTKKLCLIPRAPTPSYLGGFECGRDWFKIGSITKPDEAKMFQSLQSGPRPYLKSLIEDIHTRYPNAILNIIGFSMGAITALDFSAYTQSEAFKIGKVIAICGGFNNFDGQAVQNLDTQFYLIHNPAKKSEAGHDEYVPYQRSEQAFEKLSPLLSPDNNNLMLINGAPDHEIDERTSAIVKSIINGSEVPEASIIRRKNSIG